MEQRSHPSKNDLRALELTCREQAQKLDDAIHLDTLADIEALCAAIATLRNRPILLEPMHMAGEETGLTGSGPEYDKVFFAGDVSGAYQEHIILHELAHLLLNHQQAQAESALAEVRDSILPLLGASHLPPMLTRSRYDLVHEQEAELLASLVEQRWRRVRPAVQQRQEDDIRNPAVHWLREQAGELNK